MTRAGPERSRGERLDEAIDRVAAQLTAVSSDPGFAARLEARLDARSSRLPIWVAACAATAVVVAAVVINLDRPPQATAIDPSRAAAVEPSPTRGLPDDAQGRRDLSPAFQAEARPARRSRRPQPEVVELSVTAIAALTTPQTLKVDELTFESLTIAPVEFGHLDLANLEVPAIDEKGEPKE